MPTINFTGLASGLDTKALIEAILAVERQPIERLQERQALFNQQRSALDELRSKLSEFEGALRDLSSTRTFRGRTTTVSDESVLRASAGPGAELGLFNIEVDQLAAAHKVKSDGLAERDTGLVTDGTITIQSGDNDLITIDVSAASFNNSLQTVRDEINAADAGVEASIIFDGSDYLLTVRAEDSGTENALTITDSTNLNLDDAGNEVTAASDARIYLDGVSGIEVTSSSNKVSGIIPGVTLDLLSAEPGTTVTVEVAQDIDGVVEAAEDLVGQYNDLIEFFNKQNNSDNPGVLGGDATLRGVQLKVQSLFTRGLDGIAVGGIRSLSSVGVGFDGKTGKADLDTGELRELLETSYDEVGDLFLSSGNASHPRIQFVSSSSETVNGEYAVEVTSVAEQATLVGSTAITDLRRDEDLTITVGADEVTVSLLRNMEIAEVVDTINADLSAAGIGATASNDAGKLRITTDAFGSDQEITVESSRNDPGNGRQTGFSRNPATDSGADLVGSIGGVAATADGQFLTAADDGDYAGLVVRVTASADDVIATGGDFETVAYSRGLIDALVREVDAITQFDSGVLDVAREGLDKNIERMTRDIERIEDRLVIKETRLIRTFSAAERAIQMLQAQQAQLTNSGF